LWNYDPGKADVLPGNPVAHGKWASIDSGHRLVTMRDGRVLDFVPANGGWRLWNYDASTADVLPGNPVAHGTWTSMADGGGAGGGARKVVELKHDSITFDNGVPVGGWSALVLRADGSFTYSGHFHDSGIPDYKVSDAWVVLDSEGWAYRFAEQGTVEGSNHLFGPDRDHDWAINGSNADLARRWGVLGDPRYRTTAKADMDTLDMIKTLVDEVEEIGGAVQKIVAVVGPIVAMV
jgi:hypothetical protein